MTQEVRQEIIHDDENTGTDLATIDASSFNLPAPTEFKEKLEGAFGKVYEKIEDEIESFEPDLSTKASRGRIASLAYKISRTKTGMAAEADLLVSDQKEIIATVTASRKEMESKLDALRDKARKPLTLWEEVSKRQDLAASKARGFFSAVRAQEFNDVPVMELDSAGLSSFLDHLARYSLNGATYGPDNVEKLKEMRDAAVGIVSDMHTAKVQAEKDAAELAELRKMRAEQEEREAAERAAAEEKAQQDETAQRIIDDMEGFAAKWRIDGMPIGDAPAALIADRCRDVAAHNYDPDDIGAHNMDRVEKQRDGTLVLLNHMIDAAKKREAEAEERRIQEAAKARAEEAARKAKEDAEREAQAKIDAERAEAKRKQEELEAENKRIRDEQAKREAEQRRQAEEARKREEDLEHRKKVNGAALNAMEQFAKENEMPFDKEVAKTIIRAIGKGAVAKFKVQY